MQLRTNCLSRVTLGGSSGGAREVMGGRRVVVLLLKSGTEEIVTLVDFAGLPFRLFPCFRPCFRPDFGQVFFVSA